MAVYNSENNLEAAIESVMVQDIGFEDNIQLIIVNDGSSDRSLEIAIEFQNRFPENILILNQPHKGLAHARNLGLKHAEGKYVSFLDSDDYFSRNTLNKVYHFFEKNHFETDVVSIPIYYVGNQDGEDELNNKELNSGIVNLEKTPNNPQLSISSSFFKSTLLKKYSFDTNLIYSDGSAILNKILLRKGRYGYLESVKYYYRIRNDLSNLSKQVIFNKQYYTDSKAFPFRID